jgi:hypothetical protein
VLRSDDRVEQLALTSLIRAGNDQRDRELEELVTAAGLIAGKTIALCLGVDPEHVDLVVQALAGGD